MAPTARRALQHLPEKVALAAAEFITGPLLENPQRVGKPLHGKYAGRFSARRGELRIIYAVNEAARAVEVSDLTTAATSTTDPPAGPEGSPGPGVARRRTLPGGGPSGALAAVESEVVLGEVSWYRPPTAPARVPEGFV